MARLKLLFPVLALAVVLFHSRVSTQSLSYTSGQNISPAFEGWEKNADGTFSMLFGYMNRNWVEELDVPVGANNSFSPGQADQGQPTHFLPRRNRFIFRVKVPADFGSKELVWTLNTYGKEEKAYGTLRTDYFVDDIVVASETGALGAGSSNPEMRANKRPVVNIEGEKTRTVKVGQPLALSVHVTDDGVPRRRPGSGGGGGGGNAVAAAEAAALAARGAGAGRGGAAPADSAAPAAATAPGAGREGAAASPVPRGAFNPPSRSTVGKVLGLHQGWFVYRGAGKVTFNPPQVKVWEDTRAGANSPWAPLWTVPPAPADGKWKSTATFDEPGTYILRARADDGMVTVDDTLTVTVTR